MLYIKILYIKYSILNTTNDYLINVCTTCVISLIILIVDNHH